MAKGKPPGAATQRIIDLRIGKTTFVSCRPQDVHKKIMVARRHVGIEARFETEEREGGCLVTRAA